MSTRPRRRTGSCEGVEGDAGIRSPDVLGRIVRVEDGSGLFTLSSTGDMKLFRLLADGGELSSSMDEDLDIFLVVDVSWDVLLGND